MLPAWKNSCGRLSRARHVTALKRSNVELVTDPIAEIGVDSVVCESGEAHPVDLIVYATGFHANRFLWPMEIEGRGGVKLREQWGDDPSAYLGDYSLSEGGVVPDGTFKGPSGSSILAMTGRIARYTAPTVRMKIERSGS